MSYGIGGPVGGVGVGPCGPVGGVGCGIGGAGLGAGVILVLFILLVIISRSILF